MQFQIPLRPLLFLYTQYSFNEYLIFKKISGALRLLRYFQFCISFTYFLLQDSVISPILYSTLYLSHVLVLYCRLLTKLNTGINKLKFIL